MICDWFFPEFLPTSGILVPAYDSRRSDSAEAVDRCIWLRMISKQATDECAVFAEFARLSNQHAAMILPPPQRSTWRPGTPHHEVAEDLRLIAHEVRLARLFASPNPAPVATTEVSFIPLALPQNSALFPLGAGGQPSRSMICITFRSFSNARRVSTEAFPKQCLSCCYWHIQETWLAQLTFDPSSLSLQRQPP